MEQEFIDRINANPQDRLLQLVYADLIDEQGDPRGEAWRVLLEADRFPDNPYQPRRNWCWWWGGLRQHGIAGDKRCYLSAILPRRAWTGYSQVVSEATLNNYFPPSPRDPYHIGLKYLDSFFAAMDLAATAWVRAYKDQNFDPQDLLTDTESTT